MTSSSTRRELSQEPGRYLGYRATLTGNCSVRALAAKTAGTFVLAGRASAGAVEGRRLVGSYRLSGRPRSDVPFSALHEILRQRLYLASCG